MFAGGFAVTIAVLTRPWMTARARGWIVVGSIAVALSLYSVAVIRNQGGVTPAVTMRIAFEDHRLAVEAAWFDIGKATTSDGFYAQFGKLAAADTALADTLHKLPVHRADINELRDSYLKAADIEKAIAGAHGGPDFSDDLTKLLAERQREIPLEESLVAALGSRIIR